MARVFRSVTRDHGSCPMNTRMRVHRSMTRIIKDQTRRVDEGVEGFRQDAHRTWWFVPEEHHVVLRIPQPPAAV